MPDEAGEARLRLDRDVCQGLGGRARHVAGALGQTADLARAVADRPSHLPGDLLGDRLGFAFEGLNEAFDDPCPFGDRHRAPSGLATAGGGQRRGHLRGLGERPLDIDAAIGG